MAEFNGFESTEIPTLPSEPFPPTVVEINGLNHEYTRRYTTLEDPVDLTNLVAERLSLVGVIASSTYIGVDIKPDLDEEVGNYYGVISRPQKYFENVTLNPSFAVHFDARLIPTSNSETGFSVTGEPSAPIFYAFYQNGEPPEPENRWGLHIDSNLRNYLKGMLIVGDQKTPLEVTCPLGNYKPIVQIFNNENGVDSVMKGLYVQGPTSLGGFDDTCTYQLYVEGSERVKFDVDIDRDLNVSGDGSIDGNFYVGDSIEVGDGLPGTGNITALGNGSIGGNLSVTGALTKGSGTFDIQHPLKENYRLRHSFVEAPRYDNIYRNKVQLKDGRATINLNIDCVSPGGQTMEIGTWEKLNRNPDIFLQNNTGWDRVKGTINGSILTIECENPKSTDLISWMVVAERQDEHILNSNMSDSMGRLILEYKS